MAKINQYPAKTVPSNNDEFVLHDPASGSTKKMTRGDLIGGAPLPAKSVTLPAINGGTTAGVLTTDASGNITAKPPKIGIIQGSVLGTTGNKAITGVGFKPSLVEFTALPDARSAAFAGSGKMSADGTQFAVSSNRWGGGGAGENSIAKTNRCIILGLTSTGSSGSLEASYVSMDSDGFTINVTAASGTHFVAYTAYP